MCSVWSSDRLIDGLRERRDPWLPLGERNGLSMSPAGQAIPVRPNPCPSPFRKRVFRKQRPSCQQHSILKGLVGRCICSGAGETHLCYGNAKFVTVFHKNYSHLIFPWPSSLHFTPPWGFPTGILCAYLCTEKGHTATFGNSKRSLVLN